MMQLLLQVPKTCRCDNQETNGPASKETGNQEGVICNPGPVAMWALRYKKVEDADDGWAGVEVKHKANKERTQKNDR